MPVRPRGSRFQADVRFRGERIRYSFDTLDEATIWEADANAAMVRGQRPAPPRSAGSADHAPQGGRSALTLGSLLAQVWAIDWSRRKAGRSLKGNADRILKHVLAEDKDVRDVTKADVDKVIAWVAAQGNSGSTINRYLSALSRLFRQARDTDPTISTPPLTFQEESPPRHRTYTDDEERMILETWGRHARPDLQDLFAFLFGTGCRVGEALKLRWEHVQVLVQTGSKQRVAPFAPDFVRAHQGRQGTRVVLLVTFADTKTGDNRTIPAPAQAAEALMSRWAGGMSRQAGPWDGVVYNGMFQAWEKVRLILKLGDDAGIHTIRHTALSRLAAGGVDAFKLQKWAGHKDIQTTLRYVKLATADLFALADVVDGREGGREDRAR